MQTDPDPSPYRELLFDSEPGFEAVMECVFAIAAHEGRLYLELLAAPDSTVAELAERVNRDRSNVNRGLSTLQEKGLVTRRRRLLDSGGHVYQYRAIDPEEARGLMHRTLEEWTAQAHQRIDEFPD